MDVVCVTSDQCRSCTTILFLDVKVTFCNIGGMNVQVFCLSDMVGNLRKKIYTVSRHDRQYFVDLKFLLLCGVVVTTMPCWFLLSVLRKSFLFMCEHTYFQFVKFSIVLPSLDKTGFWSGTKYCRNSVIRSGSTLF